MTAAAPHMRLTETIATRRDGGDLFSGPPIPLDPPSPPELPSGILEGWVEDMVFATAAATETPPILAASFAISVLATAGQGRFVVNPTTDYFEELAFWTACAMQPGSRKTAVMRKMVGPLFSWQQQKAREFQPIVRKAEADDTVARARVKELRGKASKADDPTDRAMLMQQAEDEENKIQPIPVAPRLCTEDCTPEHLATMLKQHGERLSIFSDEGGAIDGWAGRYSNGVPNLDVYLKGFSGSPTMVDRGSRPSVLLNRPTLSIGLAPQPSVIGELVNNVTFRRRGAVARFFLFLPNSGLGYRTLDTTPVPEMVANEYARRVTELIELPPAPDGDGGHKPRLLSLSGAAFYRWKDFCREVEDKMRPDEELDGLTDWAGKLPGAAARIAGLFHLARHGTNAVREDEIADDTVRQAVELARFAIPHTKAVFEGLDRTGNYEAARKLWRRCETDMGERSDPTIVTARDLWHPHRGTYKSIDDVEPAIHVLIDHNWLAELDTAETGKRGRPSRRFKINPEAFSD